MRPYSQTGIFHSFLHSFFFVAVVTPFSLIHIRKYVTQLKRLAEAHKFPQIFWYTYTQHSSFIFSKTCTSAYYTHGILFINRKYNHSRVASRQFFLTLWLVFSATNLLKPLNFDRYLSQLYRGKFRFFLLPFCVFYILFSPCVQRGEPKCVRDEAYSYKTHKHQPAHNIKNIYIYVAAAAKEKEIKRKINNFAFLQICFLSFHFSSVSFLKY